MVATRHDDDVTAAAEATGAPRPRLHGASAAKLHLTLAAGLALCTAAFVFEVGRALGGNTLSWAYVFEWPIFAAFAVYMWWHLLHDVGGGAPAGPPADRPAAPASPSPLGDVSTAPPRDADPELVAWQAYLAGMEAEERRQADDDGSR